MPIGLQLSHRQEKRQVLTQKLTQQQILSYKLLQTAGYELQQELMTELVDNPALELEPSVTEVALPAEALDGQHEKVGGSESRDDYNIEEMNLYRRSRLGPILPQSSAEDANERRQFFFESITAPETLASKLEEQLRNCIDLAAEQRRLCEAIIPGIDDAGYLRISLSDLAAEYDATVQEMTDALKVVQGFDPAGGGARDLRECLMLQLQRKALKKTLTYRIVDKHLELVKANKIPQIARSLRVSVSDVYDAIEELKQLSPAPGRAYGDSRADFIYPEVSVFRDGDGEWDAALNNDMLPRLRLSEQIVKLLNNPDVSKEDKTYLREKITSAKGVLQALGMREATILRVVRVLIDRQREFFAHGPDHIQPLTRREVAEVLELEETTVGRAVNGKYLETPFGVYPLSTLFQLGVDTGDGKTMSRETVKGKLKELIDQEDKGKPLSDQKLVQQLKTAGIDISRRTVAKYREELNIPSTSKRRTF